jgi:hypothetical protein
MVTKRISLDVLDIGLKDTFIGEIVQKNNRSILHNHVLDIREERYPLAVIRLALRLSYEVIHSRIAVECPVGGALRMEE